MTDNTDLIKAYEFVAGKDQFLPSDLADEFGHNMRYSREIIAVLMDRKLAKLDTSTDMDFYVPITPDDPSEVRAFGMKRLNIKEDEVRQPKERKAKAKPDTKDYHPCGCGCGENVPPKSNYRPGHDARHAGQVGRAIAESGDWTLIDQMPTEALVAKARKIAEGQIDKASRKSAPRVEEGTVTVGKTERAARKSGDVVEYLDDKGEWKRASKTAATTFVA